MSDGTYPWMAAMAALSLLSASMPAGAATHVFCADRRIEVDDRSLSQMKTARGSNVCSFGSFDYVSDAEKHAQNFGGKGARCSCGH